jgi:PTH2 family peptidyl-tRNA hydrolase
VDLIKRLRGVGELKQVIAVRADLKLSKGKLASQVAHASVTAAEKSPQRKGWIDEGQKKSVVKVASERELLEVFEAAKNLGLPAALIEDAGRTEIPAGTKTCVGIGPAPEKEVDKVTGRLKLL